MQGEGGGGDEEERSKGSQMRCRWEQGVGGEKKKKKNSELGPGESWGALRGYLSHNGANGFALFCNRRE